MSKFKVDPLPNDFFAVDCCTIARSSQRHSLIFVKAPSGEIFHAANRFNRQIDLVSGYDICNDNDRSVYAKLAGIRVKELTDARKAERAKEKKDEAAADMRRLKEWADRLGLKLVPKGKPS